MKVLTLTLLSAAVALAACATDDDRSGGEPTAKERTAATSLIEQVRAIDNLTTSPGNAAQLLTATTFAPVISMLAPVGMSVTLPSRNHVIDLRPCITQTSDTVVYTDCEIAEHVVEGSLSDLDERLKAELVDVFVINPENHGASTIKATLNSSGDSISGTLDIDVMWTSAGADNTVDASIRISDVMVDANGCAIGGSVTVSGHIGDLSDTSRTLYFGPICGDLRISR